MSSVHYVATADHAKIAVKRRQNPGGTPIILVHGLASNADIWDLPSRVTDDFTYHSLATVLHEAGYDVWMMNLRGIGSGDMHSEAPPWLEDWCVDHFIVFDLPAVVNYVREKTSRAPFLIGQSMGSMTIAGYLQGVSLIGGGSEIRIEASAESAKRRQSEVEGAVFIEFPAALRWPDSPFDAKGNLLWDNVWRSFVGSTKGADANYPFEIAARLGWLEAIIAAFGNIPLDKVRSNRWSDSIKEMLPPAVVDFWNKAEKAMVEASLNAVGTFNGTSEHRAEIIYEGRELAQDQIKAGVISQLAKSVRAGSFVSKLGTPDHVYADHYDKIELSNLVISGGQDRIANPDVTREAFFEKMPENDKEMAVFDEIGHGEFEAAPIATALVYPRIQSWLKDRDK